MKKKNLTLVIVTHEPDIADYAKRMIVFRDGHITARSGGSKTAPGGGSPGQPAPAED